ncbi:MAG: NUDIX hydrolase [Methanolinea sp.]|nr:NUDIX hydrolase [Methanolinea sp.]
MTDLYRGRRLSVERVTFPLPTGKSVEKIVVHPGNAVAMLPLAADGTCYLIRQYRFAIGTYILEAPAGTLNPGEEPLGAAHRELIEETGYRAGVMTPRGFIYTTPGFTDERIYLYEARDLSPSDLYKKDEDEVIELAPVHREELRAMIMDGRIVDAKTISLIFRCFGPAP